MFTASMEMRQTEANPSAFGFFFQNLSFRRLSEVTKPKVSHKTKKRQCSYDRLEFYLQARDRNAKPLYSSNSMSVI